MKLLTYHLGSVFECENRAHPLSWWISLSFDFTTLTRSPSLPPTISTLQTSFTSPVPFWEVKWNEACGLYSICKCDVICMSHNAVIELEWHWEFNTEKKRQKQYLAWHIKYIIRVHVSSKYSWIIGKVHMYKIKYEYIQDIPEKCKL